jgi:hypothetical protein
MIKAIGYVSCVIVGTILLTITTIALFVQGCNMEMIEEADYWNNYFKTHYR